MRQPHWFESNPHIGLTINVDTDIMHNDNQHHGEDNTGWRSAHSGHCCVSLPDDRCAAQMTHCLLANYPATSNELQPATCIVDLCTEWCKISENTDDNQWTLFMWRTETLRFVEYPELGEIFTYLLPLTYLCPSFHWIWNSLQVSLSPSLVWPFFITSHHITCHYLYHSRHQTYGF